MKLLVSILNLSLSTHALAFDFALAAPIKRSERATPTITMTVYRTEVRKLSTSYNNPNRRGESVVYDSSAFISNTQASEALNDDAASSMATAFLWPRGASGEKPTISQLPVTGLPVSFNARQVGFVHFDDDTKRDEALHSGPNTVNKRSTDLYHIKIDLASEGYISVFMSNSTASAFCKSEVELDSEGGPKGELQLAVRNSTKVVAIPVHQEAADSFCLHFKNAESVDSPSSGKGSGSSTAIASVSEGKMSKVTPSETTSESMSNSSKHASTTVTASETDTDDSASATSATSTDKNTSLNTFDITHEIETSKSTKHVPTEETASESGSAISETAVESTGKASPEASATEHTISESEATKSSKHKSTSVTASDSDLDASESATDVSGKHKTKSTASGADEDSSKTVEASGTPTVSKAANADPSEPEESASLLTNAKSKTSDANETEEMPESATSVQEYRGPAVDPANPTDLDTSSTPKATPAAIPVSTTTDEPFTEASINSFYSYIKSFVETAPDIASIAGSTDQASIKTTDSASGALRRGILIAPTSALIGFGAETNPHSTDSSMTYTSDYSWKGAVSTAIASTTASSNAAIRGLKPPSLLWRMWYPATTTKVIRSRSFSGPGEEPEQEDEGFFNIDVGDDGPTRVSASTNGVEEETAIATKFAHKQEDNDGDDEGIDAKDGDEEEEEEEELPADEETVPDEEAETDEGAAGDDETPTSTKSKASHTKTAVDEEDDSAPTTDTSTDVEEKVTSTKTRPADDDDGTEPTATASEDVKEKATSTKLKPVEDDDEATPTFTSSKDVKEKATSSKTKHADEDEEATPTSKAADDTPPKDDDDEESQDDTSAADTPTSTSHKPKSTKPATSTSDDDAEEEPPTTSTSKSKSTHKSKTPIPSLASGVSFAFPSTSPNATPLPTPPPIPTGTAPIPTQPIIWDPDCPQISTSTLTAPNGVTTTLPMTVGLGCWRTLPQSGNGNGGDRGNETSGTNSHMIKSKAWNILSDTQNVKLGVVCWMIIGGIFFQ